ncbi:MAG: hypothetical protein ACE5FT_04715 [Candidatus Nanoarchaeia archaeon]
MTQILQKTKLSSKYYLLQIEAPEIAKHCQPGQFVMIHPDDKHRLSHMIAKCDKKSISILFSEDNKDAKYLMNLRKGMSLQAVIGPLGKPIPLDSYGNICIVCEGEGVGPALFLAAALKQFENRVIMIAGFPSENAAFWTEDIEAISNKHAIAIPQKGESIDALIGTVHNIIRRKHMNLVLSLCNIKHMAEIAKLTELRTKNLSFLTPIIHDGVGMCGTCRLLVDGEIKLACQDGPALDGSKINWPSAMQRYKSAGRVR